MATDLRDRDAGTLWRLQRTEAAPLDIDEIRRRALDFQRQIRRRNRGEYVACALVVVLFGFFFWVAESWWARMGSLLVISGTLYVCAQLHKRGSPRTVLPGATFLAFHRNELERQRDALRSVWRWYLGPFVPGLIVFHVGGEFDDPPVTCLSLLGYPSVLLAVYFCIFKLNQWAARKLQRELDELAALERDD